MSTRSSPGLERPGVAARPAAAIVAVDLDALGQQFLDQLVDEVESVVDARGADIDGLLHQGLLQVVEREAVLQRRAGVHDELLIGADGDHGAHHQDAAGAVVKARAGPDLAPADPDDHVDEVLVVRVHSGLGLGDILLAENAAADGHAFVECLFGRAFGR